ncbi:MAG: hypothetical protein JSR75_15760 [Proteobacteria bacterium]|nr:hypothetical protein [Pseudomonadota bacterium]
MNLMPVLAAAALAVTGCATTRSPTASFAALSESDKISESSRTLAAIQDDWDKAMAQCDSQMQTSRERFYGSGKTELSIAAIGIVAGSVVVPALAAKAAAAKSAVAGWGGVAGAANAAQYTLQQKGVSASRFAASYEATRAEIKAATARYTGASTNSERLAALYDLFVACRYPALPGAEAPSAAPPPSAPTPAPVSG